jgi:hypothetical protein
MKAKFLCLIFFISLVASSSFAQLEDTIVLNSEYLVTMGAMKPVFKPIALKERDGLQAGTIAFNVKWATRGSSGGVTGGWESVLWWLRNLQCAKVKVNVKDLIGNPLITFRFYQRHIGVGFKNDFWEKNISLQSLGKGWNEIVLDSIGMIFNGRGVGVPKWSLINYMTVTFHGRNSDAVSLLIESPSLVLRDGRILQLWDPDRVLAQFDSPSFSGRTSPGKGNYLIGKGGSLLGHPVGRALMLDIKKLIPNLGIAANGGVSYLAEYGHWLNRTGIAAVYQQGGAFGLSEIITKNKSWLTSNQGVSRNDTYGAFGMVGMTKYYDMSAPAVRLGFADAFKKIAKAGISEFQVIESYWPYLGGFWGRGSGELARLKGSLAGIDSGLIWKDSFSNQTMHFWDYFRFYNGFIMEPSELGLNDWNQFEPPPITNVSLANTDILRKHFFLMMNLTRYEALKFYGDISTSAATQRVHLGTITNKENYDNSYDILGLSAQENLKIIGHEYFGNPRSYLNESFEHGAVLQKIMASTQTELRGVVETNATGTGGRPYLDPQIAYASALATWAADRPESVENDWLGWYPRDLKAGNNPVERERYADFILKGMAFNKIRQSDWKVADPGTSFAVIKSRHINDIGAPIGGLLTMLRKQFWPRISFDFSEARFLSDSLKIGNVLLGEWSSCTEDDISWLTSWLDAKGGRTLVVTGYRPGKKPDGINYIAKQTQNYFRINSQFGYQQLLGTEVQKTTIPHGTVTSTWLAKEGFPASISFPSYYQLSKAGEPLVRLGSFPVVSKVNRPNGSRVIYIHYDPNPTTASLDSAILDKIAKEEGLVPEVKKAEGLVLRKFSGKDGIMVAAFNQSWLDAFQFVYDPLANVRMKWKWNGPSRTIMLDPTTITKYAVNLLTGEIQIIPPGNVILKLRGVGCAVWIITDKKTVADRLTKEAKQILPYLEGTYNVNNE